MYAASFGGHSSTLAASTTLAGGSAAAIIDPSIFAGAHLLVATMSLFCLCLAMLKLVPRRRRDGWASSPVSRPMPPGTRAGGGSRVG